MDIQKYDRRLLEKSFIDSFPYTAMYTGNHINDCLSYSEIPLVRDLERLAIKNGYQVRLELYPHHKVCDVVIENDKDCCFYKSSIAISYSLINERIIGCDITNSMEDPVFTEFMWKVIAKYIELTIGDIEK